MQLFSRSSKNKKVHPDKKIPYILGNGTFLLDIKKIILFSYISGNKNPKKILYISGNGNPIKLLIFREMELFRLSSKNEKNPPQENFLHSKKMDLSSSNIKKFLTFSQVKAFLIFQEAKTPQKLLIFQKTEAP